MDYPAGLPYPLRSGYGITPENNILRTPMVSGRARQRLIYTSVPSYIDLSFLFTAQEGQLFESWSVVVGGDWFNVTLKTPAGLELTECRFAEVPQGPQLKGVDLWEYRAKAETRDGI